MFFGQFAYIDLVFTLVYECPIFLNMKKLASQDRTKETTKITSSILFKKLSTMKPSKPSRLKLSNVFMSKSSKCSGQSRHLEPSSSVCLPGAMIYFMSNAFMLRFTPLMSPLMSPLMPLIRCAMMLSTTCPISLASG